MILKASYGRKHLYGNVTDFNPYFGTDYGICSIIKPQLAFDSTLDEVPYWKKVFGKYNWNVRKGAEVGKANGLSMLLDAETFDYTFHLKAGEGFKIAVHHHLDQPIMSIKELDISPGSVFQVIEHCIVNYPFIRKRLAMLVYLLSKHILASSEKICYPRETNGRRQHEVFFKCIMLSFK